MGDRYILEIICPECGEYDDDCYYAPTCGFIDWECPICKCVVDLEKYTGISKESCSNRKAIEEAIDQALKKEKA